MNELWERINYQADPIEICMKSLTTVEQYEVIRIALLHANKEIRLCTHDNTDMYVNDILKEIQNIRFYQCFTQVRLLAPSAEISSGSA
jgi:hypothetical protein